MKKFTVSYKDTEISERFREYTNCCEIEFGLTDEQVRELASEYITNGIKEIIRKVDKRRKREGDRLFSGTPLANELLEMSSQLKQDTGTEKEPIGELEGRRLYSTENMEQEKVSDCCGAGVHKDLPEFHSCCKSCGEPCDAVEPVGHRTEATVKIDQEKVAEAIDEKLSDDTPTVKKIDPPEPYNHHSDKLVSLDVPEIASYLQELHQQQETLLEALEQQGIIKVDNNQN